MQDFAIEAEAKGVLVCLASKNAEADVMRVFDERPDMHLERRHVVAHRINWELKSANLRALARELNLGLDSFVFLDDNPVECGLMQEMLPEVVTLQLPSPEGAPGLLANLWTFDKASVTAGGPAAHRDVPAERRARAARVVGHATSAPSSRRST